MNSPAKLASNKRWREKNRAYYVKNREKAKAAARAHRLAHPELVRKYSRSKTIRAHGITVEQYEAMLAKQGGKCAMCHRPFRRTPHIDHCHKTGRVRGLLCAGCNVAVGAYELYGERARQYLISAVEAA